VRFVADDDVRQQRLLLTGAAGRIGTAFFAATFDIYHFRLADRSVDDLEASANHDVMALDVSNLEQCRAACEGIDVVVHLAADASPEAEFYDALLESNIKGTYNIFRAAKDAGCRRVVFASSVHAVAGYPDQPPIAPDAPVRPMNMYGVSKCFGEAVAAQFAHAEGLSSIAIRIGAYEPPWTRDEITSRNLSAYLSGRDMSQLLTRCIETPDIDFAIVHGISNNRIKLLDLSATQALLGYEPQDDGFEQFELRENP
jgi:nucleoside-diphosphate-sugar epimerase